MASAKLDPEIVAHLEWLGFVRPTGLVVSAPALVRAGAILDRRDAEGQRLLRGCVQERTFDSKEGPVACLPEFRTFAEAVLGWSFSPKGYAGTTECPIPTELDVPLPDYGETLRPDFAVRELEPKDGASSWQLLVRVFQPGEDFDRVVRGHGQLEASAHGRMERLLRQTGVPAGLLFNGHVLRLVSAPRGESSGWLDFRVADMVQTAGRPISTALRLLLGQPRLLSLPRAQRFAALLDDSRKFQNEVSERLGHSSSRPVGNSATRWSKPGMRTVRRRIRDADEKVSDEELRDLWDSAQFELDKVRLFGDLVLAAFFDGDKPNDRERKRAPTPADMLKGYLLANIKDVEKRTHASRVWKERVQVLAELGKDEDADAIKSWLRSQYAESIRERKRGAVAQDFDLIGTEFHRWVRDHERRLALTKSTEFARFIERDFAFYARWYERLRHAADRFTPELECVYYNAQHNFTLQYPVLLAPVQVDDNEATALRKLRVVAAYLDILIHRRIWNWRAIDYSTVQYAMFLVMRDIRSKSATELASLLRERLLPWYRAIP